MTTVRNTAARNTPVRSTATRLPVARRRQLLLEAAWRVLVRDGVAAATTRTICAEAGMPQASFHYCFTGREELLREVASGLLDQLVTDSTLAIERAGSLQSAIRDALLTYWAAVEAAPGEHQVLYELTTAVVRDETTVDIARHQYRGYLDAARQTLERAAQVRRITWQLPLDVLARQVVTILDGLTLHWLVDRDSAAATAALDAFAHDLAARARRTRVSVPA